jgi:hypothetical protein
MADSQAVGYELRTLDQIVDFCRTVQVKFGDPTLLQSERRNTQRALIDICRRCIDRTCPEQCEVKKAYRATL